ncbi:acyltransferase, partial [Pseudomonadales bacterium]|nr:acyltransferase [Pseudomonadales bacterium]
GLRAIAVLAVVIFHINPMLLPGGYIGVDIFFVISGYLIIGFIWRDLNNNSFSLLSFYASRFRRLLPALLAMISACGVAAYFLSLPEETSSFSKSLISTVFYVSNFFFYTEADYFNSSMDLSPLLHTWSLSVEEQFYLIFPVLLLIIYLKRPKYIFFLLSTLAILSLILSEALIHVDESLAFFSTPSRFFQFIAGGFIALLGGKYIARGIINELLSLAGLVLIAICLFAFDDKTLFPGINALMPTIATAMIIYAGGNPGILTKLLSNKIAQFFGKISYSLYLWHWPIIVFYKIGWSWGINKYEQIALLIASILAGYLSWKYIENTTRFIKIKDNEKTVILRSLTASFLVGCIALYGLDGVPNRYSEQQQAYSKFIDYETTNFRSGQCFLDDEFNSIDYYKKEECIAYASGKKNYLLIGDSHAAHFYSAFEASMQSNETITQVTSSGCRPTIAYKGKKHCVELNRWAYNELIESHYFDVIFLSGRWVEGDITDLVKTIEWLGDKTKNITVLGPIIEYDQALPRLLATDVTSNIGIKQARMYAKIKKANDLLMVEIAKTSANYISVLDYICADQDRCLVTTTEDIPMQFDYGHLTHEGAVELLGLIRDEEKVDI